MLCIYSYNVNPICSLWFWETFGHSEPFLIECLYCHCTSTTKWDSLPFTVQRAYISKIDKYKHLKIAGIFNKNRVETLVSMKSECRMLEQQTVDIAQYTLMLYITVYQCSYCPKCSQLSRIECLDSWRIKPVFQSVRSCFEDPEAPSRGA